MKLLLTFVFAVLLSGLQAQVDTVLLDEAGHFYFEDPFCPTLPIPQIWMNWTDLLYTVPVWNWGW